uniref:Translocation protein SEC63 homolog n=1 Tax=Esox lucius TaxID=8010 RepID=A0AAY5KNX4_ESOLU
MAGQQFQYDDSGNTFFYFLTSFVGLIVIPATYYLWPRDQNAEQLRLKSLRRVHGRCLWYRLRLMRSQQSIIPTLKKAALLFGWAVFLLLAYKVSKLDREYQEYNPYEVLSLDQGASVSEIKKQYRLLSLKFHPDKGGDEDMFMRIAKAYSALTNDESRQNWETYGNPDGPRATSFGIALPAWIVDSKNSMLVLLVYGLAFMVILPVVVGTWWYRSIRYSGDQILINTTQLFMHFMYKTPNMNMKRLCMVLTAAFEFDPRSNKEATIRPTDNLEVPQLIRELGNINVKKKEPPFCYPYSLKARVLVLAHLARMEVSEDIEEDQRFVVKKSPALLQEMVNVGCQLTMMANSRGGTAPHQPSHTPHYTLHTHTTPPTYIPPTPHTTPYTHPHTTHYTLHTSTYHTLHTSTYFTHPHTTHYTLHTSTYHTLHPTHIHIPHTLHIHIPHTTTYTHPHTTYFTHPHATHYTLHTSTYHILYTSTYPTLHPTHIHIPHTLHSHIPHTTPYTRTTHYTLHTYHTLHPTHIHIPHTTHYTHPHTTHYTHPHTTHYTLHTYTLHTSTYHIPHPTHIHIPHTTHIHTTHIHIPHTTPYTHPHTTPYTHPHTTPYTHPHTTPYTHPHTTHYTHPHTTYHTLHTSTYHTLHTYTLHTSTYHIPHPTHIHIPHPTHIHIPHTTHIHTLHTSTYHTHTDKDSRHCVCVCVVGFHAPRLVSIENCMKLTQMVVQGLQESKSPLLQLPHFEEEHLRYCISKKYKVRSLQDLVSLKDSDRRSMLRFLGEEKYDEVMAVLGSFPHITMETKLQVLDDEDSNNITAGSIVTVTVTLTRKRMAEVFEKEQDSSPCPGVVEEASTEDTVTPGDPSKNKVKVWQSKAKATKKTKQSKKKKLTKKKPLPLPASKAKQANGSAPGNDVVGVVKEEEEDEDASDKGSESEDGEGNKDSPSERDEESDKQSDTEVDEIAGDDEEEWEALQQSIQRRERALLETKSKVTHPVYSLYYPEEKHEWWWLYIADRRDQTLVSMPCHVCTLRDTEEVELKFPAPSKTGNYQYSVILRSDSYMGLDQIRPLKLEVHEAKAILDNHPQWDIPETEEEDEEQEDSDGIEESEEDDQDND